ncbi:MAG: hypothetical protein K9J27_05365 [Bacteroidales bacterium]|nr:hypothetical protein [Bacteroidales bacterium]MCF8333837.1 hypothetical protein [Bacteroidales bacterium]
MGDTERLKNYSNYQLLDMVSQRYRYNKDLLIELLKELDKRKVTNDRVEALKAEMPEYKRAYSKQGQEKPQEGQTESESLPQLFSIRAIFFFSMVFSTFFGSLIMAFNLREMKQKTAILPLVSFGFIYTATIASISQHMQSVAWFLAIALNAVGAFIIIHFFWNSYIGQQQYNKRSITIPLLIGIGLSLPIIYFMSQNGMAM